MAKKQKKTKKNQLKPLELAAVHVVGKLARKTRDDLDEGSGQSVDFLVHIHGAMSVGCVKETKKTETPSLTTLLAWVLTMFDVPTRKKIVGSLIRNGDKTEVLTRKINEKLLKQAESGIEAITHHVRSNARGDVTGSLKADLVERRK